MLEIASEARTERILAAAVAPRFEAVLRALAPAGEIVVAAQAFGRQGVAFGKPELDAPPRAVDLRERRLADVAQQVFGIDEVVARIDVAVVLDDQRIAARLAHRADPRLHAAPLGQRRVEHLYEILAHVGNDPLVKHVAEETPVSLGRHGPLGQPRPLAFGRDDQRAVVPRDINHMLHGRQELHVAAPHRIAEETVDLRTASLRKAVHDAERIELDAAPTEELHRTHHPLEGRPPALRHTEGVVDPLRAVEREAHQKVVRGKELAPRLIDQHAVSLQRVLDALASGVFFLEGHCLPVEVEPEQQRLAPVPAEGHRRHLVGLDDRIVTKIIEIENTHVTVFSGNYTAYADKKKILRNMQLKEYLNQQREIKHQQEVITKLKQFNREKSIKRAESREKMLNKMEFVDKPEILNDKMDIKLEPNVISGNDVLTVDNLTKGFDGTVLFDNICFQIKRGERVALIGSNGTGKTTILKLINGIIPADSGSIYLGAKVNIGYYDQEHHVLDPDKTIFDEIRDAYPDLNNTQIRNTLAAFLFTNEDVFKYIKDLSGGERGRVSLAKLMLSNANFLILDEPTNHLDITSKEILENALNSYTGTVLFVSHDRYFINSTATRIIELANKTVVNYIGNYDYYLEKKDILGAKPITNNTSKSSSSAISKLNWQEEKVKQAQQKKIKNEIKRTEERMALIEAEIEELDNMYADPAISSDTAKLMEIHTRKEALSKELDELYDKWGELTL